MDESLDNILGIAPDATTAATKHPVEVAVHLLRTADIIDAETVAVVPNPGTNLPNPGTTSVPPVPVVIPEDPHEKELTEDMEFARSNMKDLIDQGRVAMQGALELAEAGDQPRAYEVVATMLTAVIQANKELISLHETRKKTLKTDKETKTGEASPGDITIKNAVFVGRAQDLLRSLKDIEKEAKALTHAT